MYVWNIGGSQETTSSSNILSLTADIYNVVNYTCRVSGDGGTDFSDVSASVTPLVKPQTPEVSGPVALVDGDTTNLTCTSQSSALVNETYVWYKSSVVVSGATSTTYTTPVVSMSDDDSIYTCKVVFNGVTSDESSTSVTLTVVPQAPIIASSVSGNIEDASSFTLTCSTPSTGLASETYVWTTGGTDQPASPSASLSVTANISDVSSYTCKVSGDGGTDYSAVSSVFTPSVAPKTPILTPSTGVAVADGGSYSINCFTASTSSSPVTYSFYLGTSTPPFSANQTSNTYDIAAVTLSDAGEYRCTATVDGVESAQSSAVTLSITAQTPTVTLSETEAIDGNNITLVCTTLSSTTGTEVYKWLDNSNSIVSGESGQQYTFTAAFSHAGNFSCSVVLYGTESAVSAAYTLSVTPQAPEVTGGNTTVTEGSDLALACGYPGTLPPSGVTYVWYNGTTVISGATTDTYTLINSTFDDTGSFACGVTVAGLQSNTSADYSVSVRPQTPTVSVSPTPPVADGSSVNISCSSSSEALMTGLFTIIVIRTNNGVDTVLNSVNVSTSVPYTTTVSASDAGDYSCKIAYRGVESLSSSSVTLSVKPQTPSVSLVEADATDGDNVTLQCVTPSSLSQSTSYSWKFGDPLTLVSGETGQTLPITNVAFTDAGNYSCSVTHGAVTSDESPAYLLEVKPLTPSIGLSGGGIVVDGATVVLTCTAASSSMPAPVVYSFYNDNGLLGDGTSNVFTFNPVDVTRTGNYTCRVTANGVSSGNSTAQELLVQVQTPSVQGPGGVTSLTVDDGSSVNVSCETSSSLTLSVTPVYTWYGVGNVVLAGQSGMHYTLSAASLANSGDLKCSINYNNIDSSISTAFPLSVKPMTPSVTGPSSTVGSGASVTLTCSSSSLPPGSATLTYAWEKGGAPQSETTSQLTLDPTMTSDSGDYACTVSYNGVTSNVSEALTLTVQDPPQKPVITPSKLIVGTGDTVTLSCDTSSSPTSSSFTFIWTKGGVDTATTSQVLTLSPAIATDAGSYVCVVVDGGVSSPSSNSYTLTVTETQSAPNITVNPATFDFNDAVDLVCEPAISGSGYSYVWSRDGVTLSETGNQLSISSFGPSDTGTYTCAVVDQGVTSAVSAGTLVTATSAPAKPSITTSPSSFSAGDTVTLTCSGSEASYEWVKDGAIISGESSETLTLSSFSNTDTGSYTCVAISSTAVRSAVSDAVHLSPQGAPAQPVVTISPTSFVEGASVNLTCASTSSGSLTIAWFKDGSPESTTTSTLAFASFQTASHAGSYTCKVTLGVVESLMSDAVALSATAIPGTPTVSLSSSSIVTEESVTLTCTPAVAGVYLYSWSLNGSPIPSETSATYTTNSATTSDGGDYTCTVTDDNGLTSSASAAQTLTVTAAPSKPTIQSLTSPILIGSPVTLRCVTTSSGTFDYTWTKDSSNVGITTQDLTFASLSQSNLGSYTCSVVESGVTSVTSDTYVLAETAAPNKPNVTYTPTTFEVGARVDITCEVSPYDSSYTYTWKKDGAVVSGQTSRTITYVAFGVSDFGDYQCTVVHGSLTSPESDVVNIAALYAPQSLSISHGSVVPSINLVQGEPLSVTCAATCLPSCTFTWTKSGETSPTSSTSQLTLASVTSADAGTYVCTATNAKGSNTVYFDLVVDATPSTPSLSAQPSTFTLGDEVNVTCLTTSTGNSLTYQWRREGVLLAEMSSQLTISSYSNDDTGSYTCRVLTTSLSSVDSIALDLAPSDAPAKPTVTFAPSTPALRDQVTLTCTGSGTHRWFKDGVLISGSSTSTHVIASVLLSDVADYSCDVNNAQSVRSLKSDAINLLPLYGPADGGMSLTYDSTNVTSPGSSISSISGSLLEVQCRANCNPACEYTWHKTSDISTFLSTNANLSLANVQLADEGSYICTANNTQGSSSFSFALLVTAGPENGSSSVSISATQVLLVFFAIICINKKVMV